MMTEQELQAIQKMVDIAVNALEDVKAKDIIVLDTSEKTSLFSRMIIASGDSTRQVKALANNVAVDLKEAGFAILSSEGQDSGEWALVDADELVVHVMLPAVRDFYDIEALWGGEKPSFPAGATKPWHAAVMQTYRQVQARYGDNSWESAGCLMNLGLWHEAQGEYASFETLMRQSAQLFRRHRADAPTEALKAQFYYARALCRQGKWQQAAEQAAEVYSAQCQYYGEHADHDDIAHTLRLQGNINAMQPATLGEALPLLEQAAAMLERLHGMHHAETAYTQIAEQYAKQGYVAEAQSVLRSTDAVLREQLGSLHPYVAVAQWRLAECCDMQRQYGEAQPHLAEAERILRERVGEAHPLWLDFWLLTAEHCAAQGQIEAALSAYGKALFVCLKSYDEEHPASTYILRQITYWVQQLHREE